jgi:hypothetical protein
MAANDDSATDPSPENDPKDNLRLPASAIASFGKREAVGIVGQADLALQEGFEVGAKRLADQASRVGILDMPVGKRFRPRDANADSPASTDFLFSAADQPGHCPQCRGVVSLRCGNAAAPDLLTTGFESDDLDFCAAQVYANAQLVHTRTATPFTLP